MRRMPWRDRTALLAANAAAAERVTLNFNPDGRFIKDDPAGLQAHGSDDSRWTVMMALPSLT
jgi:hypothetical protein